ncbi:MAG: ferredoxin, partial [Zestosphaera sp.]
MIEPEIIVKEGVIEVAKLMVLSATTAPKARGINNVEVRILNEKEELETLATKMEELSKDLGDFFARDAQNVRSSEAVVLVGGKVVDVGVKSPKAWRLE